MYVNGWFVYCEDMYNHVADYIHLSNGLGMEGG